MCEILLNSQFFFETGAMATPTKSKNPTVLGLGVPAGRLGKEEQAKIMTFFLKIEIRK